MKNLCGKKTKYWSSQGYIGDTQIPSYKPYAKPCILSTGHRGKHNNGNLRWHQTTEVKLLNGKTFIEIDKGVANLVQILNSISGLYTGASCQGTRRKGPSALEDSAYVSIYGVKVKTFIKKLLESI